MHSSTFEQNKWWCNFKNTGFIFLFIINNKLLTLYNLHSIFKLSEVSPGNVDYALGRQAVIKNIFACIKKVLHILIVLRRLSAEVVEKSGPSKNDKSQVKRTSVDISKTTTVHGGITIQCSARVNLLLLMIHNIFEHICSFTTITLAVLYF